MESQKNRTHLNYSISCFNLLSNANTIVIVIALVTNEHKRIVINQIIMHSMLWAIHYQLTFDRPQRTVRSADTI